MKLRLTKMAESPNGKHEKPLEESPVAKSMPVKIDEFLRQSQQIPKDMNKIKHVETGATELLLGADVHSFKLLQQEKLKMSF